MRLNRQGIQSLILHILLWPKMVEDQDNCHGSISTTEELVVSFKADLYKQQSDL